jgi:flagellar motor protein MotB
MSTAPVQEPQLQPGADAAPSTLDTVLSKVKAAAGSTAVAAGRRKKQQSSSEQQQQPHQQDMSLQHQQQEQQHLQQPQLQQPQQQAFHSNASSASTMSMAPLDSAWGGDDAVRGLVYGATVRFSDSAALRLRRRAMVVWEQVRQPGGCRLARWRVQPSSSAVIAFSVDAGTS